MTDADFIARVIAILTDSWGGYYTPAWGLHERDGLTLTATLYWSPVVAGDPPAELAGEFTHVCGCTEVEEDEATEEMAQELALRAYNSRRRFLRRFGLA